MGTFLIVDDDESLHKVLVRVLKLEGHKVVGSVYNGSEAVEFIRNSKTKPDIILMDHRMPVMDGTTATREILALDSTQRILFISADETAESEALKAGAVGFLLKPIRSADLFRAVKSCLGEK